MLRRMLDRIAVHYQFIILDCPPSLSLLSVNAIVAADGLIIPVVPEPLVADTLDTLLAAVGRVRTRMTSGGRVLGILLSAVDPHLKHAREIVARLRAEHRERIFRTEIPLTTALLTAPAARKSIDAAAPHSPSADAFRRLTGEVLQRLSAGRR